MIIVFFLNLIPFSHPNREGTVESTPRNSPHPVRQKGTRRVIRIYTPSFQQDGNVHFIQMNVIIVYVSE